MLVCKGMIRTASAAVRICVVIALCCCGTAEAAGEYESPLAVVGSVRITEKDFMAEIVKSGFGLPRRFEKTEEREALLEDMVRTEVLYAMAVRDGYDKSPAVLDALKRIIINQYRQDRLEPALSKIAVTEDEILAFYKEHAAEFTAPQMVRAAVIRISVPAKAADKKRAELLKRAEDARAEALMLDRAVSSFGALAVKYSDDQSSRYRGGDIGFMKRGSSEVTWSKEVMDAIVSLQEPGQVSPVVVSAEGYYLVKLMETRAGLPRHLAEVKEIIQTRLFFEKKLQKEKEFYAKLAAELDVEINRELLGTIKMPHAGARSAPPAMPR